MTLYHYFVFQGSNSDGKTELSKDFECATLMTRAETCLTGLMNSVKEGTVKVATLKLLEKHTDQFLKLGEIYETNQQVETSVQVSFSQRLSERNAFLAFQVRLECFIHFCNIFTSGKYILFLFPE
jgi:ribosomal protein S17E